MTKYIFIRVPEDPDFFRDRDGSERINHRIVFLRKFSLNKMRDLSLRESSNWTMTLTHSATRAQILLPGVWPIRNTNNYLFSCLIILCKIWFKKVLGQDFKSNFFAAICRSNTKIFDFENGSLSGTKSGSSVKWNSEITLIDWYFYRIKISNK